MAGGVDTDQVAILQRLQDDVAEVKRILRHPPDVVPPIPEVGPAWAPWDRIGMLRVGLGNSVWEFPVAVTLVDVRLAIGTPSVGADVIVDVFKNGVSIFGTKPRIVAGATLGNSTDLADTAAGPGDVFRCRVDQVGTTTAGSDLTVLLVAPFA